MRSAVHNRFRGEFQPTIDGKGRIVLPAKIRHVLEHLGDDTLIITRAQETCLLVYPIEEWGRREEKLQQMETTSREDRWMQRQALSRATDVVVDRQGRILIPPKLKEHARLDKDLIIIGMFSHFEIWDKATYETTDQEFQDTAEAEVAVDILERA